MSILLGFLLTLHPFQEEKEDKDVEDLLQFAENLDFDQYVNDAEVRAALEQVCWECSVHSVAQLC